MIKKFLDLGMQPLANKYLKKRDIIKKKKNNSITWKLDLIHKQNSYPF
jgi:hypothetical protein